MATAPWRRRFTAPRVSLPTWARDEPDRLLYASNATGTWELYAWDRAKDDHRQVTDRPEGTLSGALDPTGEVVWWFDDDRGNEFGRWMVEPFETTAVEPRPAVASLPAAYSNGLALGSSLAVVGGSDEAIGSFIHVARDGEATRVYAHREQAEVAGLSRNEDLLCITHSEHGDSRHPAVRVLGLDGEPLADLSDGPGLGLWPAGWSRVPGDRRVLVLHERRDLPRPMLWHPETGEVQDLDVELPGEVEALWYPDGEAVLLAHDHRGRVELLRLDLSTGSLEPLDVEPGNVTDVRIRDDGEVWYAWTRSSTPPQMRAKGAVLLRPPGEPPPPGVAYTDLDAGGVHVFLAEPGGERPYPTLFAVHGGPTWHDRDAFSATVQAWIDHGFAVALVNYRGSTGYGRRWRDALEGNPGLTELEDIARVRARLVEDGVADPNRIVLSGASWGGYLTLLGLGTQSDLWSLGIAGVPVADYLAAYEDEMEPLKAFDRSLFGAAPDEDPELFRARSPITFVEHVRVPVRILAGENDPRCPIRQIDNYLGRLRQLGATHEVYRYEAGHGSLRIEEQIRQVEGDIAFAARHLGTPRPL